MRSNWLRSLGLALLGGAVIGCQTSKLDPRPPFVEEFGPPPADDARYFQPPTYPAEKNVLQPKKSSPSTPGLGGLRGGGGGAGMGGAGMGAGPGF
jgi:hypothetical protein